MSKKVIYNKSKTYLLPLLSDLIGMDAKFFNHLENTYVSDDLGLHENCLYILHDFSFKNPEFTSYEHEITNNQYFKKLYDIGNQVLYVYEFPKEYLHEYNCYKTGKYSNYNVDAKKSILQFYTKLYKGNLNAVNFLLKVKQVLYKSDKLRKRLEKELNVKISEEKDLGEMFDKQAETFEISKYIKK